MLVLELVTKTIRRTTSGDEIYFLRQQLALHEAASRGGHRQGRLPLTLPGYLSTDAPKKSLPTNKAPGVLWYKIVSQYCNRWQLELLVQKLAPVNLDSLRQNIPNIKVSVSLGCVRNSSHHATAVCTAVSETISV